MSPQEIKIKYLLRLNKVASSDYSNIQDWQIRESFNKGQLEWTRRQIHGINTLKEGDEESKMRVDDLNVLLNDPPINLPLTDEGDYVVTNPVPSDYAYFKRVIVKVSRKGCPSKQLGYCYFIEEANAEMWQSDENKQPSFKWSESFFTIVNNKIKVYTNGDFTVDSIHLIYYRFPTEIDFLNCTHLDGTSGLDVSCEFKNDVAEILVDEGVEIMKIDLEMLNTQQSSQRKENNN